MRTINRRYLTPVAFTTSAVVALVGVAVVIVLPDSTSGTAEPSSALTATRALDVAIGSLAGSPAVSYTGIVTIGDRDRHRNRRVRVAGTSRRTTLCADGHPRPPRLGTVSLRGDRTAPDRWMVRDQISIRRDFLRRHPTVDDQYPSARR